MDLLRTAYKVKDFSNANLSFKNFDFPSSAPYFLDNFKRILSTSYVPTNEDILHVRQATSGVHEMCLSFVGRIFTFVDDGGQRSERKIQLSTD